MTDEDVLTPTARLLYETYGRLTINMKELAKEMHMSTGTIVVNSISAGTFPVHTYKLGRYRVCDIRDLAEFFDKQRKKGN
jgi:hypothetical protein